MGYEYYIFDMYGTLVIKLFEFDKIMAGVLISSDTGYMKPDDRFYDILLSTYNIDSSRAVMFGDSLVNDVRGAKDANVFETIKDIEGEENG